MLFDISIEAPMIMQRCDHSWLTVCQHRFGCANTWCVWCANTHPYHEKSVPTLKLRPWHTRMPRARRTRGFRPPLGQLQTANAGAPVGAPSPGQRSCPRNGRAKRLARPGLPSKQDEKFRQIPVPRHADRPTGRGRAGSARRGSAACSACAGLRARSAVLRLHTPAGRHCGLSVQHQPGAQAPQVDIQDVLG